jgi:hypothetical protein
LLPHKHQLLIKNAKKPLLDLSFVYTKDAISGKRFSPVKESQKKTFSSETLLNLAF